MNLPLDPSQSPSVDELPPPTIPAPPKRGHRWPWIVAAVGTVAGVAAIIMAINGDNDLEAAVALHTTEAPAAAPAGESAGSPDAGTGNASVDEQIVDALWDTPSGKAAICPSFNELKATMPSLSEDEIIDMGMSLAGDMDGVTPVQVARLRELVKSDC